MSKSRDIDIEIAIARPVREVYEAWLKPDLLESWLAYKAIVEPAVGGAYELFWDPAATEENSTRGCRITELVPNSQISFSWKGPVQYAESTETLTQVFIRLEPKDGGTLLRFVHTGWGFGPRWEEARLWQEEAWKAAIENLKNLLETTDRYMENISMN